MVLNEPVRHGEGMGAQAVCPTGPPSVVMGKTLAVLGVWCGEVLEKELQRQDGREGGYFSGSTWLGNLGSGLVRVTGGI